METVKSKEFFKFAIFCIIASLGWIIPPVAPITPAGWKLLSVFVAAIYGWSVSSEIWPSMLTFALLPFTGMATLEIVLAASWGSDIGLVMVLMLPIITLMEQTGATACIAALLLTRKFVQGHPWRLIFMIFFVGWALCTFVGTLPGMLITWSFIYKICDILGYKKFDKFANLLIFGVAVMGAIGLSSLPFKNNALVILNAYMASSGQMINYMHYMAYSLPYAIFAILGFMVLCKFVFKLDISALRDLDTDIFTKEDKTMTSKRWVAVLGLAAYVTMILIPSILPADSTISIMLNKMGLSIKAAIVLVVLDLIRIDGEKVLNFQRLATTLPWNMMLMLIGILTFVQLLGSADAGISAFLSKLFVPMFAGKPTIIFFLLVLLITVFLTNFMINMVVAVIMMAATLPMVPVLGLDPLQVVYLITIACTIAFMLPASSQAACFLFANKDWVRAKDMYGYAFPTIILFSIIIMVWNVIFFAIF